MELHAWFNAYRATEDDDYASMSAHHMTNILPEWFVEYGGQNVFNPGFSVPVVSVVLLGALNGSKILVHTSSSGWLRWVFAVVVTFLASQMIYNGFTGKI